MSEQNQLDEALGIAKGLIRTDENGDAWIKTEDLRSAMSQVHREALPRIRGFAQAKALAAQDPELVAMFPEPPLGLGPTASAKT